MTASSLTSSGSTRRWRRLRAFVLDRDAHRCQVPDAQGRPCGQLATHVDHVVRRVDGGTDDPRNLRAACASCNLRRTAPGHVRRPGRAATSWSW